MPERASSSVRDRSMIWMAVRNAVTYDNARTLVFWLVLLRCLRKSFDHLRTNGLIGSASQAYTAASRFVFGLVLRTPSARRKVEAELSKAISEVEDKMAPRDPRLSNNFTLPVHGKDAAWLSAELRRLQVMKVGGWKAKDANDDNGSGREIWKDGRMSGAVYHGGQELIDIIADAIKMFMVSNPLHPDAFPGVRKMEAEVVSMCLRMYNAPQEGVGTTTSGGTESILMACKAYRDWGRSKRGIKRPEIVIPVSAHAAFDKAGSYFNIKVHHVPVDPVTRKVDVRLVERAITRNTVMIVGSAPNFPDGAIDDIPSLATLARQYNVGMHVDCCLGSFIVPFLEKAGLPTAPFDFRVDGVTSISCDTHKYGFAPKGSSVIMYCSNVYRHHQYYVQTEWPGGVYASPSIAGSRPGALIAGTWAAMMSMGEDGYISSCKSIVGAARRIEKAVRDEIPDLRVLGSPIVTVVAFTSVGNFSIYEVGDRMSHKGWSLNALMNPPALHIAATRLTVPVADEFIRDLKECVQDAKTKPAQNGNIAALYGLGSSSAIGPTLVGEMATRFLDVLTKPL